MRKANVHVRYCTGALVKAALETRDQTQVEKGVQLFHAPDFLQKRVNAYIAHLLRKTQTDLHYGLGVFSTPRVFQAGLWAPFENMISVVVYLCFKSVLLQHVLSRKYDDVNYLSLLYDELVTPTLSTRSRALSPSRKLSLCTPASEVLLLLKCSRKWPSGTRLYQCFRGLLTYLFTTSAVWCACSLPRSIRQ